MREASWVGRPEVREYGKGPIDGLPLLSDDELTQQIRASGFPNEIVDHLMRCINARVFNRRLEAMRCSPETVIGEVRKVVETAAQITELPADELVKRTDFRAADLHRFPLFAINHMARGGSRQSDVSGCRRGGSRGKEGFCRNLVLC